MTSANLFSINWGFDQGEAKSVQSFETANPSSPTANFSLKAATLWLSDISEFYYQHSSSSSDYTLNYSESTLKIQFWSKLHQDHRAMANLSRSVIFTWALNLIITHSKQASWLSKFINIQRGLLNLRHSLTQSSDQLEDIII